MEKVKKSEVNRHKMIIIYHKRHIKIINTIINTHKAFIIYTINTHKTFIK